MCFRSNIKFHSITWEENVMKNNATFYRKIAVIGIALLVAGITRTSRADDERDFPERFSNTKTVAELGSS
jgi:hypothetical protein